MSTLQTVPTEPVTAPGKGDRSFPVPPSGSAKWRRKKERALCQIAAASRFLGGPRQSPTPGSSTTGILTYHHVAKQVASDPFLLNVTPQRFREQIEGLIRFGYRACSLRDVVACHRENRALPDESFIVVFDDGHHSVYENAWPVLRDLGVPATIFLATGYLDRDTPLPFDTCQTGLSRCGDTRRPLTTLECEEMLGSGLIDLGSHTHTHEDFCGQPDQFAYDLTCSLQLLRGRFGLERVTFSFPYGRFDAEMQRILEQHQLLCAVTAECQCVTLGGTGPNVDPFGWGRFGATQFDTPRTLAAKLDGWYTWLQQHWRRLRR
jgi:peptidoglycan/xylan/chitin deacetylase (PgdA/CDA1 family)